MSTGKELAVLPGKIVTLEGLMAAAYDKKSVVVPKWLGWKSPRPAAWMINLSGSHLHRLMLDGMWIYTPKKRKPWGVS